MAASSETTSSKHARCISLPSRSHPLTQRVEKQLCRLRSSSEATSYCSSSSLHQNLGCLTDLYDCIDELTQLPHTQQALAHGRHDPWIEDVSDASLRLADACGTTRDALSLMKEHLQDLQSALRRRRGGEIGPEKEIARYLSSRKKMNKEIRNCLAELKRKGSKRPSSITLDGDHDDLVATLSILKEVETVTVSTLESMLSFVSNPKTRSKASGWSLFSRMVQTQRIACEEQALEMNEVEKVDMALSALVNHKSCKGNETKQVQIQDVQQWLEGLELSIKDLEEGLQCMFRRLIKSRVSLLNILSH
ncbi:uncharacterized protein LOC122658779 [Telopea speciosissima]|uniref:uncharacterized protein LOC122658779 n=1 Tax=Telopea speciosissima TaxID=54955 RepID=UPI001CC6D666|nr:uncharacterized protein LOC122658779 [Telopea speciosissima]